MMEAAEEKGRWIEDGMWRDEDGFLDTSSETTPAIES